MRGKDYTSKNLICRVAQCIPARAALSSKTARTQLILIETPTQLYLAQRQNLESKESRVMKLWSKRPYQYSSAINPTIALIVVDMLHDLTLDDHGRNHTLQNMSMLDATCGSGTFLAFALDKGMTVYGHDIKDKCVDGTIRNMRYLFESGVVENECRVTVQDVGSSIHFHGDTGKYECAVSNLPWGLNTEIKDESEYIVSFPCESRSQLQGLPYEGLIESLSLCNLWSSQCK